MAACCYIENMKSNINVEANEIVKSINERPGKERISLYVSKTAYEAFQAACKKKQLSVSEVVEEMMKQFVESLKKK